jgi:hypothetical protein
MEIKMITPKPIETLSISPQIEQKIQSRIVELSQPKKEPRYCVDGRTGPRKDSKKKDMPNTPYGQALGGDLNIASVRWLLNGGQENYLDVVSETFTDLAERGYEQLGVHYGGHAHAEGSDCGFADNNMAIMQTLSEKGEEIWQIIQTAISKYPDIKLDQEKFLELIKKVGQANLDKLPTGKAIIDHAASLPNVTVQQLEADHKEVAAVVNLKGNTTLNADSNQDNSQAFNLDLWLVKQQAQDLGIDVEEASLLTLGLYVATEMVLVENKRGIRLPILINQ